MADEITTGTDPQKKIKDIGFGGSFDLGNRHATGMGHTQKDHVSAAVESPTGFFGTVGDMGQKHAKGMESVRK